MKTPAGLERICNVCSKPTTQECSHVSCPNRKPVTAQAIGTMSRTNGSDKDGRSLPGGAIVRKPHLFED